MMIDQKKVDFQSQSINRMFLDAEPKQMVRTVGNQGVHLNRALSHQNQQEIQQMKTKQRKLIADQKFIQAFKMAQKELKMKTQSLDSEQNFDGNDKYVLDDLGRLQRQQIVEDCIAYAKIYNQYGINLMNDTVPLSPAASQPLAGASTDKPIRLFQLIVAMLLDYQSDDERIDQLIGLTFNNISCCYKREGQIDKAEVNLKKALMYQEKRKGTLGKTDHLVESTQQSFDVTGASQMDKDESALTQLNMCAIYQQKGDYQTALRYAQRSINKLEPEIRQLLQTIDDPNKDNLDRAEVGRLEEILNEKESLAAIAYYNLGCQQEHLKQYHLSMQSYKRALIYEKVRVGIPANQPLNSQHFKQSPILQQFQKSYRDMREKAQTFANYINQKQQSSRHSQYPRGGKANIDTTTNGSSYRQSNQFMSIQKAPSKASLSRPADSQYAASQFAMQDQQRTAGGRSANSKRRPMSAKNPILKAKFNTRIEHSGPNLLNDEIINIENIISEENQQQNMGRQDTQQSGKSRSNSKEKRDKIKKYMDMNERISSRLTQMENQVLNQNRKALISQNQQNRPAKNLPISKARKIRPVSSYVRKQGFQQAQTAQLAPDYFYMSSSYQNRSSIEQNLVVHESSDVAKISNTDSLSTFGITSGVPNLKSLKKQKLEAGKSMNDLQKSKGKKLTNLGRKQNIHGIKSMAKAQRSQAINSQQNIVNIATQLPFKYPSRVPQVEVNKDLKEIRLTNPGFRARPTYAAAQSVVVHGSQTVQQLDRQEVDDSYQLKTKNHQTVMMEYASLPQPKRLGSSKRNSHSLGFAERLKLRYKEKDDGPRSKMAADQGMINQWNKRALINQKKYKMYKEVGEGNKRRLESRKDDVMIKLQEGGSLIDAIDRSYHHYRDTNASLETAANPQSSFAHKMQQLQNVDQSLIYMKELERQNSILMDNIRLKEEVAGLVDNEAKQLKKVNQNRLQIVRNHNYSQNQAKRVSIDGSSIKIQQSSANSYKWNSQRMSRLKSKSRPHSAYTKAPQSVGMFNTFQSARKEGKALNRYMNEHGQQNDQNIIKVGQMQQNSNRKMMLRVQSANIRTLANGDDLIDEPIKSYQMQDGQQDIVQQQQQQKRRVRPENRPKIVRDNSSLKEIDEFVSNSDDSKTQMIYSGHHTTSLKDESRGEASIAFKDNMTLHNKSTNPAEPIPEVQRNLEDTHNVQGIQDIIQKQDSKQQSVASPKWQPGLIEASPAPPDANYQVSASLASLPSQMELQNIPIIEAESHQQEQSSAKEPEPNTEATQGTEAAVGDPVVVEELMMVDTPSATAPSIEIPVNNVSPTGVKLPILPSLPPAASVATKIRNPARASVEARPPDLPPSSKIQKSKRTNSMYSTSFKPASLKPCSVKSSLKSIKSKASKVAGKSELSRGSKREDRLAKYRSAKVKTGQKSERSQSISVKDDFIGAPEKSSQSKISKKQRASQEYIKVRDEESVQRAEPIEKSEISKKQSEKEVDLKETDGDYNNPIEQDHEPTEQENDPIEEEIQVIDLRQNAQPPVPPQIIVSQGTRNRRPLIQTEVTKNQAQRFQLQKSETRLLSYKFDVQSSNVAVYKFPLTEDDVLTILNNDHYKPKLADLLAISNDGTSGYKTGESQFDEAAFREYQRLHQRKLEEEARETSKIIAEEYNRVFEEQYRKYLEFKSRQEQEDKALFDQMKNQNAPNSKDSKAQDQEQEEKKQKALEDAYQEFMDKFSHVLAGRFKREKDFKNLVEELRQVSNVDDIDVDMVRKLVLTNQLQKLHFQISLDDDEKIDQERAEAYLKYEDRERLLLDTFPYKSIQWGLCQVLLIFVPRSHQIRIQIYKSSENKQDIYLHLRLTHDAKLEEFGVRKQLNYTIEEIENPVDYQDMAPEDILKQQTRHEDQYKAKVHKVIQAVRQFKQGLIGDIYKDFFEVGTAVPSQMIESNPKEKHEFDAYVMTRPLLIESINKIISKQVMNKFYKSKAFYQIMETKTLRQGLPKMQLLPLLSVHARKMLVENHAKVLQYYQEINQAQEFKRLHTVNKRFTISEDVDRGMGSSRTETVFLRLQIKINDSEDKLQIQGQHILEPNLELRYKIEPQIYTMDYNFSRLFRMKKNFAYFVDNGLRVHRCEDQERSLMVVFSQMLLDNRNLQREIRLWNNENQNKLAIDGFRFLELNYENEDQVQIEELPRQCSSYLYDYEKSHDGFSSRQPDPNKSSAVSLRSKKVLTSRQQRIESKRYDFNMIQRRGKFIKIQKEINKHRRKEQKELLRVFKNRNLRVKEMALYEEFTKVRNDPELRRFKIKTRYEYAIYKIQQWWRRHLLKRFMADRVHQSASREPQALLFADNEQHEDDQEESAHDAYIDNMVKAVQDDIRFNLDRDPERLIIKFQRYFRMKQMIKKCRSKLQSVHSSAKVVLHKQIKEFFEELKSPVPFNYIVSVYYDTNNQDMMLRKFVMSLKRQAVFNDPTSDYAQSLQFLRQEGEEPPLASPQFGQAENREQQNTQLSSQFSQAITSIPLNIKMILNNRPYQMRQAVDLAHTIIIDQTRPHSSLSPAVFNKFDLNSTDHDFESAFLQEAPNLYLQDLVERRLTFVPFTEQERANVFKKIKKINEQPALNLKIQDNEEIKQFVQGTLQMAMDDVDDLTKNTNEATDLEARIKIPNGHFVVQPLRFDSEFSSKIKRYLESSENLSKYL